MTKTFADAVTKELKSEKTTTTNGMKARVTTANDCVDFFFKVGASRGHDVTGMFLKAYQENPDYAIRIMLWLRDIRGGAGERALFRQLLGYIEKHVGVIFKKEELAAILNKTPEIGRWDDIFGMKESFALNHVLNMIAFGIDEGNGLLVKWLPREKSANRAFALVLMEHLGLTPRQYRKLLVKLTNVVETPMCANQWDTINFNHVPSRAANIYKTAFHRHTKNSGAYQKYIDSLLNKEDGVKVNASAIFPHDVIKDVIAGGCVYRAVGIPSTELGLIKAQWDALPDYMDGQNVLPIIDVSGSMFWDSARVKGTKKLCAGHIAQSLGLYCADKNKGVFKDMVMHFSTKSDLTTIRGNIVEKLKAIQCMRVEGSTNIEAAIDKILEIGINHDVPNSEMPKILLIMSDMQFNQCASDPNDSAIKMIKKRYKDAGYEVPKVVFWNLAAYDNVPVKFDKHGTALVSGYSPSILKSILKGNYEDFTPMNVMLETIMHDRYKLEL